MTFIDHDDLFPLIRQQPDKEVFISIQKPPHPRTPGGRIHNRLNASMGSRRINLERKVDLINGPNGRQYLRISRWRGQA